MYLATNFFQYKFAETPWDAMLPLTVADYDDDQDHNFEKVNDISLWYIPDKDRVTQIESFCPLDEDGDICGVLLYAEGECNKDVIKNYLVKPTQDAKSFATVIRSLTHIDGDQFYVLPQEEPNLGNVPTIQLAHDYEL